MIKFERQDSCRYFNRFYMFGDESVYVNPAFGHMFGLKEIEHVSAKYNFC